MTAMASRYRTVARLRGWTEHHPRLFMWIALWGVVQVVVVVWKG